MKKILLLLVLATGIAGSASAQLLPSFQFGIKGGVNLSTVSNSGLANLGSDNRAGYLGGFWARFGAAGIHFQPEIYLTKKSVTIEDNSGLIQNKANFTSIDVPLLFGTRIGALGVGARFNTGPVVSFTVNRDQNFSTAAANAIGLNYKDQNYAWQFGAGIDIRKVSIDLRYELGLNKVNNYSDNSKTRINLFNLTLAYSLFGL
ncbi:porin family protein [Mucilaginibacter sp. KACC 22063]|uniref:porin family protein n=1 Tax=Mucilaginibacter sp. KACC 22063 TaxID=3025666 RepID=UPI002366821D|nr:porin family protein [Mucilaginibacter sp. KACC 22063]WDF53445.1 porin family protein [Mucilaginibacter sp. KACC 22063]